MFRFSFMLCHSYTPLFEKNMGNNMGKNILLKWCIKVLGKLTMLSGGIVLNFISMLQPWHLFCKTKITEEEQLPVLDTRQCIALGQMHLV